MDSEIKSGWGVFETEGHGVHVAPTDEPHEMTSCCPCRPRVEVGDDNGPFASLLYIHDSFDGREAVEWADAILTL